MKSFMDKLLKQAIKVAKQAGSEAMKVYKSPFTEEQKEDRSPVTKADLASEKIILQGLTKTGFVILSEETTPVDLWFEKDTVWIVDPLDGTRDFIQKTGEFSILIALVKDKVPVLGVVYQPATMLLYFAQKDKGAFMQDGNEEPKRIKVSDVADFKISTAILSRNHTTIKQKNFVERVGFGNVKHIGSAGLKIGFVAHGGAEVYFTESDKIHQWDTAAGEIILKEAGGIVTDLKGNPLVYCQKQTNHTNGILACNRELYPKMIKAVMGSF